MSPEMPKRRRLDALMRRMGKAEGAPYANWVTWPNTTHCSRLLIFAEKHNLGDAVIGKLYQACYEEARMCQRARRLLRSRRKWATPNGAEYIMSDEGMPELLRIA